MSAVEKIRSAHIYHEALQESMQALKNVSVSGRDVNKFVYDLFLTAEQQDHMKLRTSIYSADKEVISTKTQNKVIAVLDTIEKGVGQELHRGSMLWLYNGVNCYMNNVVDYKSSEDRFEALTKRTACKVNQRAFDLALTSLRAA